MTGGGYCWCGHGEESHVGLLCQDCTWDDGYDSEDEMPDPEHGYDEAQVDPEPVPTTDLTYYNLALLSDKGLAMADLSPNADDERFWTKYGLGMALAASVALELGDVSQAWRVRRSAALSWEASRPE